MTIGLYDASRDDIAAAMPNQPAYRVKQVWEALYQQFRAPTDITSLPAALRDELANVLPESLVWKTESTDETGDTVKFLWHLRDGGHPIETVLMLYPDRATVCVSTQAGCAMACGFCATGQAGFNRHLTAGEIVEQVVKAARRAQTMGRRVSNIVFMGMGEPLANEAATRAAVERIHDDIGISARHLTVSTVGIIPGIRQLAAWPLPVNLAVSLHAARDELRNELVPINKRYPIDDLVSACNDYLNERRRRVSFEWALIDRVNDTQRDANELARLCKRLRPSAHVNLIPLNPTPGWPTRGSSPQRVREFADILVGLGVNATVRRNRGTDIDAACGQLAAGQTITPVRFGRNDN
ncbi:MAG: 23S rRNA (adenine(2503)-C(2))-methyltransferase RlmN [Acidobacteria bacterium]|nr:23S rRNA (adenine(2503)-C(2))-methyltransferase RlmN [Acidobacteriota bacterium]